MIERPNLRELQRRLKQEPDNLGLRAVVAGALREAGRTEEALALYRSIAEAYQAQGRAQQAIAVCRSILEFVPTDGPSLALLATVEPARVGAAPVRVLDRTVPVRELDAVGTLGPTRLGPPEELTPPPADEPAWDPGARPSQADVTPLPPPLPYHVADPTQRIRISSGPIDLAVISVADPGHSGAITRTDVPGVTRSAHRISVSFDAVAPRESFTDPVHEDLAAELATRQIPRIDARDLDALAPPPIDRYSPSPLDRGDDDEPTNPPPPIVPGRPAGRARPDSDGWLEESTHERGHARARLGDEPTELGGPSALGITFSEAQLLENTDANPNEPPTLETPPRPRAEPTGFLARLSPVARTALLAQGRPRTLAARQFLVREGEPGETLFLLTGGEARVFKRTAEGPAVEIAQLGRGAVIGEMAVLGDRRRHATVEAVTTCALIEVHRKVVAEVAAEHPSVTALLEPLLRERMLGNLLAHSPFFAPLPAERRGEVLARFAPLRVAAQGRVIAAGQRDAGLVLVALGALDVVGTRDGVAGARLGSLGDGDFVGEQALLARAPHATAVIAQGAAELLVLAPRDFYEIASEYPALWAAVKAEDERRAQRYATRRA